MHIFVCVCTPAGARRRGGILAVVELGFSDASAPLRLVLLYFYLTLHFARHAVNPQGRRRPREPEGSKY